MAETGPNNTDPQPVPPPTPSPAPNPVPEPAPVTSEVTALISSSQEELKGIKNLIAELKTSQLSANKLAEIYSKETDEEKKDDLRGQLDRLITEQRKQREQLSSKLDNLSNIDAKSVAGKFGKDLTAIKSGFEKMSNISGLDQQSLDLFEKMGEGFEQMLDDLKDPLRGLAEASIKLRKDFELGLVDTGELREYGKQFDKMWKDADKEQRSWIASHKQMTKDLQDLNKKIELEKDESKKEQLSREKEEVEVKIINSEKVGENIAKKLEEAEKGKVEVEKKGKELKERRGMFAIFGKFGETLNKSLGKIAESLRGFGVSWVKKIFGFLLLLGIAIKLGLLSPERIQKIVAFLWGGVKAAFKMLLDLLWTGLSGLMEGIGKYFIDVDKEGRSIFSKLIAGLAVISNFALAFGNKFAIVSKTINYVFGIIGKGIIILSKVLSWIPLIGKYLLPIAKLGQTIPVLGQIITIVISVFEFIRGFLKGFAGPEGSLLKGLVGGFAQLISALTFGLISFDVLAEIIEPFIKPFVDFIMSIVNLFKNIVAPWMNDDMGFGEKILETIKALFFGIIDILWSAVKVVLSIPATIIKLLMMISTQIYTSIMDGISYILQELPQFINSLVSKIPEYIEKGIDLIVSGFENFINYLIDIPRKLVSWITGFFKKSEKESEEKTEPGWFSKIISGLLSSFGNLIWSAVKFFPALVGGIVSLLFELIKAPFTIIISFFKRIGKFFSPEAGGILSTISNVMTWPFRMIVNLFVKIGEIIGKLLGIVWGVVTWPFIKIIEIFTGVGEGVGGILEDVWSVISWPFRKIMDVFSNIGEMIGGVLDGVWKVITAPFRAISSVFDGVLNTIRGLVGSFIDKVPSPLRGLIPKSLREFATGGNDSGGSMSRPMAGSSGSGPEGEDFSDEREIDESKELVSKSIGILSRIGDVLYSGVKTVYKVITAPFRLMASVFGSIMKLFKGEAGILETLWTIIKAPFREIGEVFGKIGDFISKTLGGLWELITFPFKMLSTAFIGIKDAIRGVVKWFLSKVPSPLQFLIPSSIKQMVGMDEATAEDSGGGAISSILGTVTAAGGSLVDIAAKAWDGVKNVVGNTWNKINSTVTNIRENITERAEAAWDGVKNVVGSAWSGIKGVASRASEGIQSAASTAWDGIKGVAGSITDTMSGIASGISSSISGLFGGREGENKITIVGFSDSAGDWLSTIANNQVQSSRNLIDTLQNLGDKLINWLDVINKNITKNDNSNKINVSSSEFKIMSEIVREIKVATKSVWEETKELRTTVDEMKNIITNNSPVVVQTNANSNITNNNQAAQIKVNRSTDPRASRIQNRHTTYGY